jgi:hypothetical protein
MDEAAGDEQGQVAAFASALAEVAARMGGVTVVSASVACQATFGTLENMTPFQRRSVNRVLAPYRVHLDFPDLSATVDPEQPAEETDDQKADRFVDMLAAVAAPDTGAGLSVADATAALGEVYGDPSLLSEAQSLAVRLAVEPYGLDFEAAVLRARADDQR